MSSVYIQKIVTEWTKQSRGAPHAALRNQVPERCPLEVLEEYETVVLQEIVFHEHSFTRPIFKKIRKINHNQILQEGFDFQFVEMGLAIAFRRDDSHLRKVGILKFNSWGQVKVNRRIPMEYTWGYHKIVFNIFHGELSKIKNAMDGKKPEFIGDYQILLF